MNEQDESTELWAEVIAAVEYLREGPRPGLTVWEVLEEGLRIWLAQDGDRAVDSAWKDPDPLRAAVEMLLRHVGGAGGYDAVLIATVFTSALRDWLERARRAWNDGKHFGALDAVSHPSLRFEMKSS